MHNCLLNAELLIKKRIYLHVFCMQIDCNTAYLWSGLSVIHGTGCDHSFWVALVPFILVYTRILVLLYILVVPARLKISLDNARTNRQSQPAFSQPYHHLITTVSYLILN